MKNMVETVKGSISLDELGFTLMHEHLYLGDWNHRMSDPEWFDYEDGMNMITGVLRNAMEAGVKTLVDVTPFNLGRDVDLLLEAAQKTGMHIVAATGAYIDESGQFSQISEENLLKMILREVREGVGTAHIRCGVIKCGTDRFGFTDLDKKLLRACGRAQKETGLPIITLADQRELDKDCFNRIFLRSRELILQKL